MDHILGSEFTYLPDSWQSFYKDGIHGGGFPDTVKIPDRYFVNHFLPSSGISRIDHQQKNVPDGR
jgi:hypothetical protein